MFNPFAEVTDDSDEVDLVEQSKNGSREALEKLILRHQAWVYNIAVRMVFHPQDAEEVTQEVLIKAVTHLGTFHGESKFRTWLYRITANHVLNMKRRGGETPPHTFATLQGGMGFLDVLLGGNGNDVLSDPDGVLKASGDSGNDDFTLFFAPDWSNNGSLTLPAGAISGGNGDDTIRVTTNNAAMRFDVSGDNGKDRIELYGTWNKVRVYGGNGTDTLKNRGIGLLEISGVELEE